jgi:hypothetical protein
MTTLETLLPSLSAVGQLQPTTPAAEGLRLRLRDPGDGDGYVDGGWWPRSLDLRLELPPLLAEMWSAGYDVFRVSYDLTAWHPVPPRRLIVSSRLVKLGGYRTQDPASISLVDSSDWKRLDLVVIPPQTDPVIAKRALALAGLAGDLHRPGEILEQASRGPAAMISRIGCVDLLPAAEWETDGGRTVAS